VPTLRKGVGLDTTGRLAGRAALAVSMCAVGAGMLAAAASSAPGVRGNLLFRHVAARSRVAACDGKPVFCSTVNVPLDRTGVVPGMIPIHVEMIPAPGTPRGVVFLVAGGPGQGSAHTFDLSDPDEATYFQFLFPGYTLVAYDDRGTGASNVLDCAALDGPVLAGDEAQVAAECASQLGPGTSFYSTADHAADLEAVRQALGFPKIAVMGVSYGTRLALAYAAAYPQHVDRLVLDSIVPPNKDSAFESDTLRAMPGTLGQYCAGSLCAGATKDFAGDVVAVVNKLGGGLSGGLGARILGTVVDADLNPGLAAELPAAFHAARAGELMPLFHVMTLDVGELGSSPADFSDALYVATVCDDGPFPWSPTTAPSDRAAAIKSALAALPPGSFGPFGMWAASLGNAGTCAGWPTPTSDISSPAGPLPDVPVLGFSGGLDLRTPTVGATAVMAQFPQGHLVVVPGVGHSVLTADPSLCAQKDLRSWILTGAPPESCARAKAYLPPLGAFPTRLAKHLNPAQTLAVAAKIVREAEAVWLATGAMSDSPSTVLGISGGKAVATATGITLTNYAIAAGVTLSGKLTMRDFGPPVSFTGSVKVAGSAAAHGTLTLAHDSLRGRLGNRKVGG
jgi:pimeloyl-ACP methyl ester carboxylesterase